jgi:hypothetical protein
MRPAAASAIVAAVALSILAFGGPVAASGASKAAGNGDNASAARSRGRRGPRGFRGRRGRRGVRGRQGFTGPAGPVGPPGPTGAAPAAPAGVVPFNFGTSLNTGAQLYAAHGVSIQGQCTTESSGQRLRVEATASDDNEALYGDKESVGAGTQHDWGDANFDAGESIGMKGTTAPSGLVFASYIGADGATATFLFGAADDSGGVDANGGSAASPSDPALGGAGCLIWGTRQLG